MKKNAEYRECDLFITSPLEKKKKEYFNEYGYNLGSSQKEEGHFKSYCQTNRNNNENKPK